MIETEVSLLQIIVLALVQGLSEFLPISSSAHLVLPSQLLGWHDQGLAFDVAVHVGTLIAVLAYFWRDLVVLVGDIYPPLRAPSAHPGELWRLGFATLPAVVAGVALSNLIESQFRGLDVIATTTLVFGVLLGWAGLISASRDHSLEGGAHDSSPIGWRHAFVIGLAQMLALVPGVSRSGVTITAALFLGYSPTTAARFSFLLSVPIIVGAMLFMGKDLLLAEHTPVSLSHMLVAVLVAGVSAYATIAVFLRLLARVGLMPFVWYRLALGVFLLAVIWFE